MRGKIVFTLFLFCVLGFQFKARAESYTTYIHPTAKFSLNYPGSWKKMVYPNSAFFYSSMESGKESFIFVSAVKNKLPSSQVDTLLDLELDNKISKLKKDGVCSLFEVIDSGETLTLGKRTVYTTGLCKRGFGQKSFEDNYYYHFILNNENRFVDIIYQTPVSLLGKNFDVFEHIRSSIRIHR